MKGLKCFGLLLVLSTIFGLSLNVSLDVNALRHDYDGIALFEASLPCNFIYDGETGLYHRDTSFHNDVSNGIGCGGNIGFQIYFDGDASSSFNNLNLTIPSSQLLLDYDSESNHYIDSSFSPIFIDLNGINGFSSSAFYIPSFITDVSPEYQGYYRQELGSGSIPSFDISNFSDITNVVPCSDGVPCDFPFLGTKTYVQQEILPYRYSYDGFKLKSTAIDSESGYHYSNTFSLSDVFNSYVPSFSQLTIPLGSYDDYFFNSDNLYQGRSFDFRGVFEFDGSFAWHDNIENNGSSFKIDYYGTNAFNSNLDSGSFDCVTNLRTITDPVGNSTTQLEYSCPFVLPTTYTDISFYLNIDGNGNYVWLTDDDWRFAYTYLVTDDDDTPGFHFNSNLSGGGSIPGDALNNISNDDPDFVQSLINLFSFGFFNPFSPIFQMFSDNNSCAQIPIIANMLHSNETEVCPWFDSSIRNIVTPVLSLSSMMLIFGFAVRWLKSGSGNLFEDSANESISNVNHSGFRRYKK